MKPDWCPVGVWDKACSCTGFGGGHEMRGVIQAQRENIARALLQAKQEAYEDAAKVASQEWRRWGNRPNDALFDVDKRACEAVASAIRAMIQAAKEGK